MESNQASELIKSGINLKSVEKWADLGSGEGTFTIALGNLLAQGSTIYAIDSNAKALGRIPALPGIKIEKMLANFEMDDLLLKDLDGILMANSLHFVKDKHSFIQKARTWLKTDGRFIVVEYDTDTANRWVPYPISFTACNKLFSAFGFMTEKIGERPSRYHKQGMYAALIPPDRQY